MVVYWAKKMSKKKQVILVRVDLGMSVGKTAAQAAHASMKVFFDRRNHLDNHVMQIPLTEAMAEWVEGEFTKIVLQVHSEQQLLEKYEQAVAANLPCAVIQDNGHTEFNGVKTYTTVAIGPADPDEINKITGNLKLLR